MVVNLSDLKGLDREAVEVLNSAGIYDIQDIIHAGKPDLETLSQSLDIGLRELRIIDATARMIHSALSIMERHIDLSQYLKREEVQAPETEGREHLLGLYPSRIRLGGQEAEIRDTGYTVSQVLHQLSTGRETRELLEDWPELEVEDFYACFSYASLVISKVAS